jgi:hypothetical protein
MREDEDDFSQNMVFWSEAFGWGSNGSELLIDLSPEVATSLLLIFNY